MLHLITNIRERWKERERKERDKRTKAESYRKRREKKIKDGCDANGMSQKRFIFVYTSSLFHFLHLPTTTINACGMSMHT